MINKSLIHLTTIALTVIVTAVSSAGYAIDSGFTAAEGKLSKRASDKERKAMRGIKPTATPVTEPVKVEPVKTAPAPIVEETRQEKIRPFIRQQSKPAASQPPAIDHAISGKNDANKDSDPSKTKNSDQINQEIKIALLSRKLEIELAEAQQLKIPKFVTPQYQMQHPETPHFAESKPVSCPAIPQECLDGVTQPPEDKSEQVNVGEHPAKFTAADLNEEFLNEVRRSYQGGEGSDNIRSEEYLNRLTKAFHYIYNNLENRDGLPPLDPNPAYNADTPNFSIGFALNRRRSDDFEYYPIVRGLMDENGAAALSMKVKVEIPKVIQTGYFSYESILEPCGPGFYQITMTNNGGSSNTWTTRINPGRQHKPQTTEHIAKCLNAEKREAQTVFSKAPAANTVHIGRNHHPAMIEAIILMVLEGEAQNRYHRLSFYDFSRNEEQNLAVMRALVLKQSGKKSRQYAGKLIDEADFTILNY